MAQPRRSFAAVFAASATLMALLILPWWRNHSLLLDFFDYGLVMAAVGRMQLGERPYVDFISPIQTLQFFFSYGGERLWGARYLSLTYTNAVFIVGSFIGLAALLWRPLSAPLALIIAAAVVVASAGQHTIIWYNAMGVVWLAIVVWLTAPPHSNDRQKSWALALVWAALWLGGMTKLTFQVASLAFAITFTLRAASVRALTWSSASWRIISFVAFGVVAPIATELIVTGATFEQWLNNVVLLPARFRTDMLGQIATLQFYLRTPHDYYHTLPFKFIGAWGVGLLIIIVGAIIQRRRTHSPKARGIEWLMLAVLGGGAWICSAVLLATNMDIGYVSAAVPLVLATGIALAYPPNGELSYGRAGIRIILGVAALSLFIPAWFAAWAGTRALWGHERLDRAALVSTDDLPVRFNYLHGMRILPGLHADLRKLDESFEQLMEDGLPPATWHFTHAMEWMVRAVPEARHAGFPLWFARGTTYSDDDTWAMADALENSAGVRVVFSYEGWNYWSAGLKALLKKRYAHRVIGHRIHVYQHRTPLEPIAFAVNTHSNLYAGLLSVEGGPVEVDVLSNGLFFFGGRDPHRIDIGFGLYRLEGELVAEINPSDSEQAITGRFQIFARDGDRLTDQLWDETINLGATKRPVLRPFSISPGGRPVTLMLEVPEDAPGRFGWRKLTTDHVGPSEAHSPWPLNGQLRPHSMDDTTRTAMFGAGTRSIADSFAYGAVFRTDVRDTNVALLTSAPFEIWFELKPPAIRVAGGFRVLEAAWSDPALASGLRVTVIAYKAGRFDVRDQRELHPRDKVEDREPQQFETWLPENSGWIGLVVTSLDGKAVDTEVLSWTLLRVW